MVSACRLLKFIPRYALCLLLASNALAVEFTVHASQVGDYTSKVAPILDDSRGLMIEAAAAAFRRANLTVKMASEVPWARAQVEAMAEPGGILVHLSRTPGREAHWKWLTIMYTDKVYAYTLKEQPVYTSYDDIRLKKPRVGAKLASASESLLKGMGVAVDATPDLDKSFLKLLSGRLDVLLLQGMEVYPALDTLLNSKYGAEYRPKIQDLRRTPILDTELWVVTSLLTPDADAQLLKDALEKFKLSEEYRAIVRKYEAKLALAGKAH